MNSTSVILFSGPMMKIKKLDLMERLSTIHKSKNFFIDIDYKLTFDTYIEKLYAKRWEKKLRALARVKKYMSTNQAQIKSSHLELFLRKGVLKICNKFTREYPCRSAISVKLLATLLKSHFSMGILL